MPTGSKTVSGRRDPHKGSYPSSLPDPICTQRWLVSVCLSMCVRVCLSSVCRAHKCVLGVCVYSMPWRVCLCVCMCVHA